MKQTNHLHEARRRVDYSLTPWVRVNGTPCVWEHGHFGRGAATATSDRHSLLPLREVRLPWTRMFSLLRMALPGRLHWKRGALGSLSKWDLVWFTRWLSGRTGVPEPFFPLSGVWYHKVARIRASSYINIYLLCKRSYCISNFRVWDFYF